MWLGLVVAAVIAGGAPDDAALSRAKSKALGESVQQSLPGEAAGAGDRADPWGGAGRGERRTRGAGARPSRERRDTAGPGPLGDIATVVLWGGVVVVVVIAGLWLAREVTGYSGDVVVDEPVTAVSHDALHAVVARPLEDAEKLAAQGRYADAIHTLLLQTLHELAVQSTIKVTPAMTSREILARVPALAASRMALSHLISAVELTWFGDDVPAESDYQRCRAQFQVFADVYRKSHATHA